MMVPPLGELPVSWKVDDDSQAPSDGALMDGVDGTGAKTVNAAWAGV